MLNEHFDKPSGLHSMAGSDATMRMQIRVNNLCMDRPTDHELQKYIRVMTITQSDHTLQTHRGVHQFVWHRIAVNIHWPAGAVVEISELEDIFWNQQYWLLEYSHKSPWYVNCQLSPQKRYSNFCKDNWTGDSPNQLVYYLDEPHLNCFIYKSLHAELYYSQDRLGSSTDIKSISSAQEISLRQIHNELEILVPGIETWDTDQQRNWTTSVSLQRWISGTGHWLLEGWIGDHLVDFIVDFIEVRVEPPSLQTLIMWCTMYQIQPLESSKVIR